MGDRSSLMDVNSYNAKSSTKAGVIINESIFCFCLNLFSKFLSLIQSNYSAGNFL